jgi:deoxyribonuclease-4
MSESLLIGAHTSSAGGAFNALYAGETIGATTIQFFTSNQRQWTSKTITPEEIEKFEIALSETRISHVMSHGSYLVNLGSAKKDILDKSLKAFGQEIQRCHLFKIPYLTIHPGSAVDQEEEECIDIIIDSLLTYEKELNKGQTKIVLETTAGQGNNVGYKFEQLGYIIKKINQKIDVGVCVDTCHIFAAGYDIRDNDGWNKTLLEFEDKIGIKYLVAFHVNDCAKEFGSRKDRHANIGKGKIGLTSFKSLMTHPKLRHLPKYLETPLGNKHWKDEISLLRNFGEQK